MSNKTIRYAAWALLATALAAATSLFLGGCAPVGVFAVDRFVAEYNCPRERVQEQEITQDTFAVTGCNRRAVYACWRTGGGEETTCRHER